MTTQTYIFTDLDHIKTANRVRGHHFFDRDTMRFFDSRASEPVIGGRFFVTSERFKPLTGSAHVRRYTLREACADGQVRTVGEFQAFASKAAALAEAHRLA